jgi:hypothetical protein
MIPTETIVRVRPTMRVVNGRTVADWSNVESEVEIPGWVMQPGEADEELRNRNGNVVRWSGFGPAGADVRATDAIRYRGRLYQVDGEPEPWTSATGRLDHTVVRLIDHEG